MARTDLASMTVDALLKLRDDIGDVLSRKAHELKQQLSLLTNDRPKKGRPPGKAARGPRKGTRVAPKYRGPEGETWTGRGLQPRWLKAKLEEGHKLEDYLIAGGPRRKSKGRGKSS